VRYAEYAYYRDVCGGTMPEEDFLRLSRQASAYLDLVCFDRIRAVTEEDVMEKVRAACCAVADVYLRNENGGGIAAETSDGISVTYVNGAGSSTDESRLYDAALLHLGHTGLMFRGFAGKEAQR